MVFKVTLTAGSKQQARQMLQENRLLEAKHVLEEIQKTEAADPECWQMLATVHGMLGELADAEKCSRQVVALAPDMPGSHIILGKVLAGLGRADEAEKCFLDAIELNPLQPQVHLNLGNLLKQINKSEEAESAYREAIRLQPDYAEAYSSMAILQQEAARRDEALVNYQQAVSLVPANMSYLYNYGCILHEVGRLGEAAKVFSAVLNNQPNHVEALNGLGMIFESQGRFNLAIERYKSALVLKPDFKMAKRRLTMLYSRVIPNWHFPMMNDEERNDVYDAALRKVVTPDSIVLDIGSGSGLLAMMAARAGAKHVFTCEANKSLANKAREIVALNGYSDVITVIGKKSTELKIGEDMSERADILVSEILDECLLGEGVVPSVYHARQQLVKEDACVIPAAATIYAALVESECIYETYCVDKASGFDVSVFNEFTRAAYTILRLPSFPHRVVSDSVEAFHFDLARPDPSDAGDELFSVPVNVDCTCHAVVFWFRLELDSELSVETSPQNEKGHWMQAAQVANPPLELKAGDVIKLRGKYDSVSVRFTIESCC